LCFCSHRFVLCVFFDSELQAPDENQAEQIDLDSINKNLHVDDAIEQGDLRASILRIRHEERDEERWIGTKLSAVKLSSFKKAMERKDDAWFSSLLSQRVKIDVDDKLIIDVDGDDLVWNTSVHYLDYFLAVLLRVGHWAVLLKLNDDHTFLLRLDLKKSQKEFPCKYAKLNFDPTGKMLYIGQCQNEDVFLALCPLSIIDPAETDEAINVAPGYHVGDT
jgi:hypothetical protein